ncbi:MAG: PEGA domain-containing protein [Methanolobus sp.]|uniref:PEGA domain-containing protein n=1 Tax=Methanolobus sp. TaxID=1874737 RepID=UPI00272F9526|nr:PEGA domain-containing protein [Methanolobus sp.]MDP2217213.1 PEGA domain-containing protein [Methanolobus sp.]
MVTVTVRIPAVGDKPEYEFSKEVTLPTVPGAPEIPEICEIGDEKTITCPDGTEIVTAICEKNPATGKNWWKLTGNKCPIKEICEIGDEKTITCPDGTEIVTHICEKNPRTGKNYWKLTGNKCPPPELGKTVKILVYPETAKLEAFDGQEITITAAVMCGVTPSRGEDTTLLVDGKETAFGKTSNGFVSFKWKATVEPARTHKICVNVPKSTACEKFGSATDCKIITVSRVIPEISEQLMKEREAYLAELEAKRKERERIRELYLLTRPPTVPPIIQPVLKGIIHIPSIPKPIKLPYPVNISIDGIFISEPPVKEEVDPGAHTILAELKGMAPISKKVYVKAGETLVVTDIAFVEAAPPSIPTPEVPKIPEVPRIPEVPKVPEVPTPEVPRIPEVPEVPRVPKIPRIPIPRVPKIPEVPRIPEVPKVPEVPTPEVPRIPEVPKVPRVPKIPTHEQGIIIIPSIPKPMKLPYPINVSIDGEFVGEPPISKEVDPGAHTILAELKGMAPISKKVYVKAGETLVVTDITFTEEIPFEPPVPGIIKIQKQERRGI